MGQVTPLVFHKIRPVCPGCQIVYHNFFQKGSKFTDFVVHTDQYLMEEW